MYYLQIDSDNQVALDPEYDFTRKDEKKESAFRACAGTLWVYKWGDFDQWKFGLKFVTSADMSVVNSWWKSNAELQFYPDDNKTDVSTVMIRNKNTPISKMMKPYTSLFGGAIELSTF